MKRRVADFGLTRFWASVEAGSVGLLIVIAIAERLEWCQTQSIDI